MKRIFTLLLVSCLVLSVNAQKKKVGYFGLDKNATMDAAAAKAQNDPVLTMLKADANLDVTAIFVLNQDTTAIDFSAYDVVVIQESFNGNSNILKSAGALALTKLTKPTLYNKTYAFRATRALPTGDAGTGAELMGSNTTPPIEFVAIKVSLANQTNDLFKGLTFAGDSVALFTEMADDNGNATTNTNFKSFNYAKDVVLSNTTTLLAQPATVKDADKATLAICFNDIPAGTNIGSVTTAARMITFGMNYGAICANNGTNITAAGLQIWKNAIYMLAGIAIPTSATGITVTAAGSATTITTKSGTLQMSAAVTPTDATDKTVAWSVDDATIATIDANGLLTAVKNGTVKVIGSANGGTNIKDTVEITISGQNVGMRNISSRAIIYPTVATDVLNIETAKAGKIEIFDVRGRKVMSEISNSTISQVNVGSLKPGTYTVRVNGKGYKFVKK